MTYILENDMELDQAWNKSGSDRHQVCSSSGNIIYFSLNKFKCSLNKLIKGKSERLPKGKLQSRNEHSLQRGRGV